MMTATFSKHQKVIFTTFCFIYKTNRDFLGQTNLEL